MTVNTANGKITASKDVLNLIAILSGAAREHYKDKGYLFLTAEAMDFADSIHEALDLVGYYDSVK